MSPESIIIGFVVTVWCIGCVRFLEKSGERNRRRGGEERGREKGEGRREKGELPKGWW